MSERVTTRRVLNTAEEDVWKRIEDEAESEFYGADSLGMLERKKAPPKKRRRKKRKKKAVQQKRPERDMSPDRIRRRHQKRQKAARRRIARARAFFALAAAAIIVMAVLLLTPLFDIRSISVSGNTIVTAEEVSSLIGDIKGTNLFLAKDSEITNKLKSIKFINSVAVSKRLIPPSVDIFVTEHIPAGYVQTGSSMLVLDKDMYIIDSAGEDLDISRLPCIIGVKIKRSEVGSTLIGENSDVTSAVQTFLEIMEQCGETANVKSADFTNMSNITFNYENRITGICGSQLNLDKKLRLFCETVKSDDIAETDRGTIDLSTTGYAIHTP